MNNNFLAIIPVREGSKRIKLKNLLNFNSKPLIYWTIKEALKIKEINKVIVSSDSKKILNISKNYGIKYFIKRPKNLSRDKSSSWDVVKHVIKMLKKNNEKYKNIILLQPTSPLRKASHILEAIRIYKNKNLNGLISLTTTEKPISWNFSTNKNLDMKFFKKFKNFYKKNKIKYDVIINGAIYIFKTELIKKKNFFYKKKVQGYLMKREFSVDVDNYADLKLANFFLKH